MINCKNDGDRLFSISTGNKTRNNGLKLKQRKCRLDVRINFLTMKVGEHWNRVLRGCRYTITGSFKLHIRSGVDNYFIWKAT